MQEIHRSHVAFRGLGTSVIESQPSQATAHIREAGAKPLVFANFVNPKNLLPYPYGDAYLQGLGVIGAGSGEAALSFTLLPGLKDYYRNIGLVAADTTVIEVSRYGGRRNGFPHGDPLEQLRTIIGQRDFQLVDTDTGRPYALVPTLPSAEVSSQADRLGILTFFQPDSDITNNKALLRKAEQTHNLPLLPGRLLEGGENSQQALADIVREYGSLPHGIWIKFPTGSGGDLVYHLDTVSQETMSEGIGAIRAAVLQAHEEGNLGRRGHEFWPENLLAPEGFPLVIEEDARNLGEVLVIGSNHFVSTPEENQTYGYFRQLTSPQGEFIGSERFQPEGEVLEQLEEATRAAASYNRDNGFFGIAGIDYFVIRRPDGQMQTYILELNSRPIISTYPDIVGQRLGFDGWINTNVTLSHPVGSMQEFIAEIGEDLIYRPGKTVGVVPLAFRTVVDEEGILPSPHCKLVILGDEVGRQEIVRKLQQEREILIGATE